MRIVDVNPFFHPWKGGIESRMLDTSRLLARRGHDVTVVAAQIYGDAPDEEDYEGFHIVRLKSRQVRIYNPPFVSSEGVLEAIESIGPDVVNFNYRWAPSYTKALKAYDGPKVFTYHNMWGEGVGLVGKASEANDDRFAGCLNTFGHVIAVSDAVRNDLLRRGYSPRFVTSVPSCLWERPAAPGDGSGDFVLSLGRLVRTKGLDYLIDAMEGFDHKLIICGKGPDADRLAKKIRKANLEDRVEMRGYVSDEEKDRLMGECRFFVMPSLFESLGLAAVEMLAHGRPVICSDADGLPETVGEGGVAVPKADAAALCRAMNDLWDDRERCEEVAAKAVERAAFYDWNIHIPEIEDVYSKVASGEYTSADAFSDAGEEERYGGKEAVPFGLRPRDRGPDSVDQKVPGGQRVRGRSGQADDARGHRHEHSRDRREAGRPDGALRLRRAGLPAALPRGHGGVRPDPRRGRRDGQVRDVPGYCRQRRGAEAEGPVLPGPAGLRVGAGDRPPEERRDVGEGALLHRRAEVVHPPDGGAQEGAGRRRHGPLPGGLQALGGAPHQEGPRALRRPVLQQLRGEGHRGEAGHRIRPRPGRAPGRAHRRGRRGGRQGRRGDIPRARREGRARRRRHRMRGLPPRRVLQRDIPRLLRQGVPRPRGGGVVVRHREEGRPHEHALLGHGRGEGGPVPEDGTMPLYCITGTPGCGKTTLSAELRCRGYEVVDGNEHMRANGLLGDLDPARDTREVDLDALSDSLGPYRASDRIVFLDSHLGHRCDCHGAIVLRCDPEVLAERLGRRGYSEAKILENVQAECLDVVLCEAADSDLPVWEIDCTSIPVGDAADAAERIVKGEEQDCRPGSVDWSSEMERWF